MERKCGLPKGIVNERSSNEGGKKLTNGTILKNKKGSYLEIKWGNKLTKKS